MNVTCPTCEEDFFISTEIWERMISNVHAHHFDDCPHCGDGLCYTCYFVPKSIFEEQRVSPIPTTPKKNTKDRPIIQQPDYPF